MGLTWKDYPEIAEKLAGRYPDQDILNTSEDDIKRLVLDLPDFAGGPEPHSRDILYAIKTAWNSIGTEPDEDGRYDAVT